MPVDYFVNEVLFKMPQQIASYLYL